MDVSPELPTSAPETEVDEDCVGRDICDPANHDWCPSHSQLPMPNFPSWDFQGRDIPEGDTTMIQGRSIYYSPTSPAESTEGPAVKDLDLPSPSDHSDVSIPPPLDQSVPALPHSSDTPRDKVARTDNAPPREEQLGVLELNRPAGARPKASGVKRTDAISQTSALPCKAMPRRTSQPATVVATRPSPVSGTERPAIPRRRPPTATRLGPSQFQQ